MTVGEIKLLKKDRFLMLSGGVIWMRAKFLLSGWTENYPVLHDLYQAKERFYTLWGTSDI